jgi:hypothetical protein
VDRVNSTIFRPAGQNQHYSQARGISQGYVGNEVSDTPEYSTLYRPAEQNQHSEARGMSSENQGYVGSEDSTTREPIYSTIEEKEPKSFYFDEGMENNSPTYENTHKASETFGESKV